MKSKIIFAAGADIKNKFLVACGQQLYIGPAIGDLSDAANYARFKKESARLLKRCKARPAVVAHDLHPGYFSTQYAQQLRAIRHVAVQHHHAHIASVMGEYGLKKQVIGVSLDGAGFGSDGHMWGGEFLFVNTRGFQRLAHLKYLKMPGGDTVVREPWRMVVSILGAKAADVMKRVRKEEQAVVLAMLKKDINAPMTSSAGRLFDAAAALLGLCTHAAYEAQGPIQLEALCRPDIDDAYAFDVTRQDGCAIVDTGPAFLGMLKDMKKKKSTTLIATKFHNTMVALTVATAVKIARQAGIKDIILSGGVFQNKFLMTKTIKQLRAKRYNVFTNNNLPANDLNIALGQYYVSCNTGKN